MLVDFLKKYKGRLTIYGGLAALLLTGGLIYYNVFFFHITSISPNPNGASYLTPRLIISFNKDLVGNSVIVTADTIDVTSSVSNKQITIMLPANLKADQTYAIHIKSVTSNKGDTLKDKVITLKTVLGSNSLSAADMQLILKRQEAAKAPVLNDPIFSYIPHSTLDYSIDGVINNAGTATQAITLTITIHLSAADASGDTNAVIAQYEQEAIDYIHSLKGININNYNVVTNVINPTL